MDANQNLTAEMIKIDPYNYTLSEMVDVIGETEAKKLFKSIYKGTSKLSYQTIKVKDVFNGGDTRKYAFELCDNYVTIIALKLFVFKEEPVLQCV